MKLDELQIVKSQQIFSSLIQFGQDNFSNAGVLMWTPKTYDYDLKALTLASSSTSLGPANEAPFERIGPRQVINETIIALSQLQAK